MVQFWLPCTLHVSENRCRNLFLVYCLRRVFKQHPASVPYHRVTKALNSRTNQAQIQAKDPSQQANKRYRRTIRLLLKYACDRSSTYHRLYRPTAAKDWRRTRDRRDRRRRVWACRLVISLYVRYLVRSSLSVGIFNHGHEALLSLYLVAS